MNTTNIQNHECQTIRKIFNRAGNMSKVIIVGIDPAAKQHKAAVCNGLGDVLCKPLTLENDRDGLAFLENRVQRLCRKHGVEFSNVIIGIENPGPWAENFADHLMQNWETVIGMDARKAKQFRENPTSDNDRLAAQSVCRCLIQKQGREREEDDEYSELLMIVRHHQKLTADRNEVSNRIHATANILFPGVLDTDETGITHLGEASLEIISKLPICRVKRMSVKQLTTWLNRRKVVRAAEKAQKLKNLAGKAIPPSEHKERANRLIIEDLVTQYRNLSEQIDKCLKNMAKLLRQTPHWLLTTIDGIGVSTAAQIAAELFARSRDAGAECKVNYSGLTSRTHQTGGDNKPPVSKGRPFSFNRRAKRIVLLAAENVANHDHTDLAEYYQDREARGKNAKYLLGRKLIRFAVKLNTTPEAYLPEVYRDGGIGESMRHQYYRDLFEKVERKWKKYIHDAPSAEKDLLAKWFDSINTCYNIKTSLHT